MSGVVVAIFGVVLSSGADFVRSLDHAAEAAMALPWLTVAQSIALAGFCLKAAPLAFAAILGALVGLARGLAATRQFQAEPAPRVDACINVMCPIALQPLAEFAPGQLCRLSDGRGYDVEALVGANLGRALPRDPLTGRALSQADVQALYRHPSGAGSRLFAHGRGRVALARQISPELLQALRTLVDCLPQERADQVKPLALGNFCAYLDGLQPQERDNFERCMVSPTGQTLAEALQDLQQQANCTNGSWQYFHNCLTRIEADRRETVREF